MKERGKHLKVWNRVAAFALCMVMVFSMLPVGAIGAESTGKVTTLTSGGDVNGNTVTFANATLKYAEADPSVGRMEDGWWVGLKVTAPEYMTTYADFHGEDGKYVQYQRKDGGTWVTGKNFWDAQDSDKNVESTERYLTMWGLVNEDYLRNAIAKNESIEYAWGFDWDMNDDYEQIVKVRIEPDTIKLQKDGKEVFPAPEGYGEVTALVEGGSVSGSTVTFSGLKLQFEEKDTSIGRNEDGWWAGIKITAPEHMTRRADFDKVTFQILSSGKWSDAQKFWDAQESNANAESTARYVTLWGLLNETIAEKYAEQDKNISYKLRFDWNGDGYYEQTVAMNVNPKTITLMKGEKQIYPVIYADVKVEVEGNGTVTVNGKTPSNGSVSVPEDREVEVVVTPADDHTTITSLNVAGKNIETGKGAYTGTHVFMDGDAIKAEFVTKYTVTFENEGKGDFKNSDNKKVTSITVEAGEDVKFKYTVPNGYKAVVTDGDDELTADKGWYTISNIKADHTVKAVTEDEKAPQITEVTVSDEDKWTTSKQITAKAEDNSGENPDVYITTTEYSSAKNLLASGEKKGSTKTVTVNDTYYIYAVDEAGNMTSRTKKVEKIDTTAPVIKDLNLSPKYNWYGKITSYTYTFNAEDAESGVVRVWYSINEDGTYKRNQGGELGEANGQYSFNVQTSKIENEYYIFATNAAGETTMLSTASADAPIVENLTISTTEWVAEETGVKVTFDVSYDGSFTVKLVDGKKENGLTPDENGQYEYTFHKNGIYKIVAADGKNVSEVEIEITNIDDQAPVITLNTNGYESNTWTNQNVKINVNCFDKQDDKTEGSGVAAAYYSLNADCSEPILVKVDANGNYVIPAIFETNTTYYVWCEDGVGYTSNVEEVTVLVDKTAPAITDAVLARYVKDNIYKNVADSDKLTLTVTAEDTNATAELISGVARCEWKLVGEGKNADHIQWTGADMGTGVFEIDEESFTGTLYVRVQDEAGNYSEIVSTFNGNDVIIIDNMTPDAPVIEATEAENAYDNGWTKEDVVVVLDGGVTESLVDYYQYRIEYANGETCDWTDIVDGTVTFSEDLNGEVFFRAVSNSDIPGDEASIIIKIQKTLPGNAAVVMAGDVDNNGWYKLEEDATVVLTLPETDPYMAPVTIHYVLVNTTTGEETELTLPGAPENPEDMAPLAFNGETSTYEYVVDPDGVYTLTVWTTDEADNECAQQVVFSDETSINVDATVPTELTITVANDGRDVTLGEDETVTFNTFYGEAIKVELNANCDISGIGALEYQTVENAIDYDESEKWTAYNADKGIEIETGSRFVLFFRAADVAGNKTIVNSTGIVVDNKMPSGNKDNETPEITIKPENPGADGFYNADTYADIQVYDPLYSSIISGTGNCSGLAKVTYTIYAKDIDQEKSGILFDVSNGIGESNAVVNGDKLVTSWSGRILVDAQTFNSNNVYIKITAVDNSGNTRTTTLSDPMKIDVTAPTTYITYNNNNGDGTFYNKTRTATIVITERNLDYKDVLMTITNTDKVQPKISSWSKTGSLDNTKHTIVVTYAADGDYTFDISCKDMAGNIGKEEVYAPGTTNPTKFTVDQTAPKISVKYSNNAVANGKYFAATRTATITVVEHNFDANRVNITLSAARGGVVPSYKWSHSGDTHTAVLDYKVDGDYRFDIKMTDLAGNANDGVAYGDSKAANDFVVDTDKEMITISAVENGKAYGYGVEVAPSITIEDINLNSFDVKLTGQQFGKEIDLSEQAMAIMKNSGNLVTGILNLFESVQDKDGIYNLTVTGTDLAGNVHEEKIVFTVNRFGSVYVFGDGLADLISGVYTQEITDTLTITEYNADRLVKDSVVITITRDGKPLDEVKYVINPEVNNNVTPGEMGWYQYQYNLSPENFTEDGLYKVYVSSRDASGNQPENANYEDKVITFWVDNTRPEITSITGLENAIYNAATHEVNFSVFDAVGLQAVTVIVKIDGNTVVEEKIEQFDDINNYNHILTLLENNDVQSVIIHVVDQAGNEFSTEWYGTEVNGVQIAAPVFEFNRDVVVSTNFFVRWFSNQPLFWGSIIAAVAVCAFAWWFLFGKRKKDEDESAE